MKIPHRISYLILIPLIIGLTYFYIIRVSKNSLFMTAHFKSYDALFSWEAAKKRSPHLKDIVVVGVDDASFERMNKAWPWGREVFAVFLENLQRLEPRVVGLDFSFVGESQNPQADEWLAESLKLKKNTVLASYFDRDDPEQVYVTSAPMFTENAYAYGFINIPYDADNVNRRTRILMPLAQNQGVTYSFATQVAYAALDAKPSKFVKIDGSDVVFSYPEDYGFSKHKVRLDRRYHITTTFRHTAQDFNYIPFWKFIAGEVPKERIKDKIVLVGPVSQILHDRHPTPIGYMAGIFINANQVLMILDKDFIGKLFPSYAWLLLLLLAVLFTVIFYELSYFKGFLIFLMGEASLIYLSGYLFIENRLLFPIFPCVFVVMSTFAVVTFYKSFGTYFENMALQKQVVRDGLSGLYGHSYFMHRLGIEFEIYKKLRREFCLVMVDVDSFKGVNDKYGHEKGNEVLIAVSQILKSSIRANDIAARYGGDEFCLILLDSTVVGVYNTLERIRSTIEKKTFKTGQPGETFSVTISSGISSNLAPGVFKKEDLIHCADSALYSSKKDGRNKTRIHGV